MLSGDREIMVDYAAIVVSLRGVPGSRDYGKPQLALGMPLRWSRSGARLDPGCRHGGARVDLGWRRVDARRGASGAPG